MNKKIGMFLLTFLFVSQALFSEIVTLNITTSDGHLEPFEIDDKTTVLNISNFIPPFNKFNLDSISGLEQLENLEVVQIQGLYTPIDFSFLCDAPNLKEIYIDSCIPISLKFLEDLYNAEIITLNVYILTDEYENVKNQVIDLSELHNLQKLSFSAALIPTEEYEGFAAIPKFSYVTSHPDLDISNNEITEVSQDDLEILSQFNKIYLWPNPILFDDLQMEKFKDLNIITR